MIRRYDAATDEVAVAGLVREAFGAQGRRVAALVADLRRAHAQVELVAEVDGRVVGHVVLSRSWVDARAELVEVLVLSPLSVALTHQGRGWGTALLTAAVKAAHDAGAPAVFLEGDPGYYAERGWEPATPHGFTRPSTRIPELAFQVVLLEAHEPWMRGALVYCEPFWAHDCVGLRDPQLMAIEHTFEQLR